jgi:hypothetical protein
MYQRQALDESDAAGLFAKMKLVDLRTDLGLARIGFLFGGVDRASSRRAQSLYCAAPR